MKSRIFLIFLLLLGILLISCDDSSTDPVDEDNSDLGTLIVDSEPAGATIWLEGKNTGEVTPGEFPVEDDNYTITLQLENYADTTYITQVSNAATVNVFIVLRAKP